MARFKFGCDRGRGVGEQPGGELGMCQKWRRPLTELVHGCESISGAVVSSRLVENVHWPGVGPSGDYDKELPSSI